MTLLRSCLIREYTKDMERYDHLTEQEQTAVYDNLTETHWDLVDQLQMIDNERTLVLNALRNNVSKDRNGTITS